jgi:SAM-dependent methyltransferase
MVNRDDWWRPENLAHKELEFRKQGFQRLDRRTDFGSYRMLLKGESQHVSGISLHNDVSPMAKVRSIAALLGPPEPRHILDAGCGAGFTTRALAEVYPHADVLGVDLAEDAIAYATNAHPKARFIARSISPESGLLGEFDLIFCFEFYPFTRNTEVEFQAGFIRYFVDQLRPDGRLAIFQTWTNDTSLAAIFEQVRNATPEFEYRVIPTPSPRLSRIFPLRIATALSILVHRLTGRDWAKPLVVVTKRRP